ncbi:MAG: hypothetical protein J6T10_30175 [Methanobrevibacter sp.]|nr:hypothetical protein [Methanobrevibacter sp.]
MFDFNSITFKYGEQELGFRVIEQAWKDANMPKDCYDRVKARCFLCGFPKIWRGPLFYWCELAGLNSNYIMRMSREKWKPNLLRRENGE